MAPKCRWKMLETVVPCRNLMELGQRSSKNPVKKNKPTTVGGSSFPKYPKLLLIVCYSNGTFPMKQPRRFSLGVYPVPINFIQFLDNFKTIPNPIFDIIMHYPFVLGAAASTYKERMTIKYRILGAKTHQMTKPN